MLMERLDFHSRARAQGVRNMAVKLKCPVCGSMGTLMQKTTKTKTTTGQYKEYRYWYVYHGKKAEKPWCYLTKENLEKTEIKKAIEELTTQTTTQNTNETNNPDLGFFDQKQMFCSYTNSILTKTSSGTRTLMILRITRSSASTMMRRLWMRISHLSQVAVPSPHGVLRTGTRSLLVGKGWGPVIFTPVFSAMTFSSPHTSSSFL